MATLSVKLLPVSPVSVRVPVDVRWAYRGEKPSRILLKCDGAPVESVSPGDISHGGWFAGTFRLAPVRSAKRFCVTVEVYDHSGTMTAHASNELSAVESTDRSSFCLGGAWVGLAHWSEEEGRLWNRELKCFTASDWRALVRSMHEIGMDVIVLQELFRNQAYYGKHTLTVENYNGAAFYPSRLYPGRMVIGCEDPVEAILDEADRFGMSVFAGVGMFAWFDFSEESLRWHCRVAREIFERYGHHRSLYGWYISEEVFGDLNCGTDTPTEIVRFFEEFGMLRDELDPTMPVMLAPNTFAIPSALEAWRRLAAKLDILCPFGINRMPAGDLSAPEVTALLQSITDEAKTHLWLDMEIFLFHEDTALYPRPMDEIAAELREFAGFEKVLCYQFPGLMNAPDAERLPGGPDTVKLYCDYRNFLNAH